MDVRDITDADLPELHALNQAWVPAVGDLDLPAFRRLVGWAWWAATVDDRRAFMIVLPPGLPYTSRNYRWVSARWRDFLYIDRVAVVAGEHGRGRGRALYEALEERARRAGVRRVACELNVRPPNPGSLAFHTRMGFRRTGVRADPDGATVVAMMLRDLGEASVSPPAGPGPAPPPRP